MWLLQKSLNFFSQLTTTFSRNDFNFPYLFTDGFQDQFGEASNKKFKSAQMRKMFLSIQEKDAEWWRNACLLYFQTFSKMPLPNGYEKPAHILEYYKSLKFTYAPGNGGNN